MPSPDAIITEELARERALESHHPQSVMERVTFNNGWWEASEFFSQQLSWDAFLCPKCGLLPEDSELVEGHDGDDYTGVMYCDSIRHPDEVIPVEEIEVRRVPCH